MAPSRSRIDVPRQQLADLCRRHHVRRLAFFGSVLRDDFRPDSDIDVLVEIDPGKTVTFFTLARLENDLADMLGRRVDLHVPRMLHPYLRDKVLSQAEDVFVAA